MDTIAQLKQLLTGLTRRPALSLVIVGMLGLGIASVTVMAALFDAVLLRGLPYTDADRLVHVWGRPADPSLGGSADSRWWTSYPDLEDLRREQTHFEDLAGYIDNLFVVRAGDAPPRRLKGGRASAELFGLLRVAPAHGRTFTPQEDVWGGEPVAVLSAGFAEELRVTPDQVGNANIELNEIAHRVIGIMPAAMNLPNDARFWVPLAQNAGKDNRGQHRMKVIGRLSPGRDLAAAGQELQALTASLAATWPESNRNRSAWIEPLHESIAGPWRGVMSLLLGAGVLLMGVVAVNVAGLLMVRAIRRRRELAIRRSLGATGRRLVTQLLGEAVLLACTGAALGLAVAGLVLALVPAWLPADLPLPGGLQLTARVGGFALGLALVAAVGVAALPAWRASRSSTAADLKPGAAEAQTRSRLGVGGVVLTVQMALAFALVVGALGLLRTAHGLLTEPLGFEAENRLAFRIFLPAARYNPMEQPRKVNDYYQRLLEATRALPGVESVAVASVHPLEPMWSSSYWIEGREPPAGGVLPEARFRPVGAGYFRTAGIPLLAGREIAPSDDFEAEGVVVVNAAFARQHFGDRDPVGQWLVKGSWWPDRTSERWRIVGVAGDVRFDGPAQPAAPALYFSQAQWPLEDRYLLIEAAVDPASLVGPVQALINRLDPAVPADAITMLADARADGLKDRLLATTLIGVFAVLVVLLAASGLYGVLSFAVGLERRQIGVRLAVGARPRSILLRYLRRGLLLTASGGVLGSALYLLAQRFAASLSSELQGVGAVALLASAAVFLTIALIGALAPARRAARLSPTEVLREE